MKKISQVSLRNTYQIVGLKHNITLVLAFFYFASTAYSQTASVHTYNSSYDHKNYSTELASPYKYPNEHYLMSGSIYNNSNYPGVHPSYLHVDREGLLQGGYSTFYVGQTDEYVVDIVEDGGDVYHVCIQNNGSGNDRIKLFKTDISGNTQAFGASPTQNSWNIQCSLGSYPNIYPLHSLWYNNKIYICGYITDNYGGQQPCYKTDKESFVMSIDPTLLSNNVAGNLCGITAMSFNSTSGGNEDYDIAMRMRVINNELLVMGSQNEYFSSGINKSVSMVLRLPLSLGSITKNWQFMQDVSPSDARDEYCIDITDFGGHYVALGNYFDTYGNNNNFDTDPHEVWINYLDVNNGVVINPNYTRLELDPTSMVGKAWGLQLLPPTNNAVLIAGLQTGYIINCPYIIKPSINDVDPFISDIGLTYSPNTPNYGILPTSGPTYWETQTGQFGTGNTSSFSNSYPLLGDGFANIAWGPTFAATGGINRIGLSAPIWYPTSYGGNDNLNLKFINTDGSGVATYCDDSHNDCPPRMARSYVLDLTDVNISNLSASDLTPFEETHSDVNDMPLEYVCDYNNPGGTGGYTFRTANPSIIDENAKVNISINPNPAKEFIQIKLEGNLAQDANVTTELYNIYGQRIAKLYNGSAQYVNDTKMPLPDVATGMYLVKVYTNGKLQSQHKLSIE